eukprot:gene27674-36486_t
MSTKTVDILIVGAGPTGLGAASRLSQLKKEDWLLVDAFAEAGGLACTDITPEGFLFDMGGHVIFSHYDYFDQLIEAAVGKGEEHWATHQRDEKYLGALSIPKQHLLLASGGPEAKVANAVAKGPPKDFDEWILRVMGEERVATANVAKVVENVLRNKTESGWGPNAVFRFPQEGGTGAIWTKVAALLPKDKQQYNMTVTNLDPVNKIVTFENGTTIKYNKVYVAPTLTGISAGW